MSDLLTSLASRVSNVGEAIRPRTLSLYEPKGLASQTLLPAERLPVEPHEEVTERTSEEVRPRVRAQAAPTVPELPRTRTQLESRPPQGRLVSKSMPGIFDRGKENRKTAHEQPAMKPVEQALPRAAIFAQVKATPSLQTRMESTLPPKQANHQQHSIRTRVHEEIHQGERPSLAHPGVPNSQDQMARLMRAITPSSPQARMQPRNERMSAPVAAPEPVIQVTIGRVEVRATSQPPVKTKEQTPSSVMSLDEYLKQKKSRT